MANINFEYDITIDLTLETIADNGNAVKSRTDRQHRV